MSGQLAFEVAVWENEGGSVILRHAAEAHTAPFSALHGRRKTIAKSGDANDSQP